MSAPDENSGSGAGGMLNGHGVAIGIIAIFVGMALVVAVAASDGAIFGLDFNSTSGNNKPAIDSDAGGAGVLSRDVFDEGSDEESTQSGADNNVSSTPTGRSTTLSEEQRRLLAMSEFSWDSIAVKYIASSQDIVNKFDQQNFTRQRPAQPGIEPIFLSDNIVVDVDRDRDGDRDDDIINIETPIDTPANDDGEEPQDDTGQQDEDSSNEGESNDENSGSGPGDESDSGSSGTDSNSTDTESSGSGGGANDTSDSLDIEASISIG